MDILITGRNGFVGSYLYQYFTTLNINVNSISMRNNNWKEEVKGNSLAIIHLAGKAHDTLNTSNRDDYFKVNTELTKEIFDEFLNSDIRDFIYFSSVKAVADHVMGELTEEFTPDPKTPYGESKLEAEKYLLSKPLPKNKRLFIIRPCMIHGPGNKGNLNLLNKVVQIGFPWPLGAFKNKRSLLSIDNLTFLLKKIIEDDTIESGTFNFSDDEPLSTNEIVRCIAQVSGKRSRIINIPTSFIKALAKVGDFIPMPLDSERLKKLTENYIVSNSKVKRALRIKSMPYSSLEGLQKTISSFKNSHK